MKARILTFQAKQGDCIFFLVEDGEKRKATMIDCGKYTDEIKKYVEDDLGKHIDFLVVTHIDNDHIDGLVEMLEKTPDVQIDKILYNCNQLWDGQQRKQMPDTIQQDIQTLYNNLPSRQKSANGKVNAEKAVTLAKKLSDDDDWWLAWKKDEYITTKTKPIALDEHEKKYGKFVVLTPTITDIEKLYKDFKTEYARLTKHIIEGGGNVEGQETLFELVERLAAMKRENYAIMEPVKTGGDVTSFSDAKLKEAYDFTPKGVSDENTASIALMWEFGEKRVLLMGDAEPDDVAVSIKNIYGEEKLEVEAIKISHHGSKHSTSKKLMMQVDSGHYFFTGGNLTDKPSLEAVMKIVNRGDDRERTLHFNNTKNKIVEAFNSDQCTAIREQYHIAIANRNEYKFEY